MVWGQRENFRAPGKAKTSTLSHCGEGCLGLGKWRMNLRRCRRGVWASTLGAFVGWVGICLSLLISELPQFLRHTSFSLDPDTYEVCKLRVPTVKSNCPRQRNRES